jgi:hypothetical protein
MPFKVGVRMPREEELSFNSLVFATSEEADAHGSKLLSRWLLPESYEIVEVEDEVTHTIVNGQPCSA